MEISYTHFKSILNNVEIQLKTTTPALYETIKESFQSNVTGSNLFFSYLYLEGLPTLTDFNNPLKTNIVNDYEMLNLQLTKRKIQTFKKISVLKTMGGSLHRLTPQLFIQKITKFLILVLKILLRKISCILI